MLRNIYAILVFFVLASLSAFAYGQDAQIQGQVLDTTGAGIPKAIIHVSDQRTGTERKIESNESGQYTVSGLAPGVYKVIVEASGFSPAGSDQITLNPVQNAVYDFTLKVGATSADIVVTAERHEEKQMDVPAPVTVLDSQTLADTSQVLLQDYATSVPGVNLSPNEINAQVVSMRGITTGGYGAPTVAVTVDGVPFTGVSENANQLPDIDPGDLARIEVLPGPQGTLYGASSEGGLINYVTKDPSTEGFSGGFSAGTSSVTNGAEPGYNVRGSINIPLSHTSAIRGSAFGRQDPGYIDNPGSCGGFACAPVRGVNKAEAYGSRLAALWQPSDRFSLKLSGLYQDTKGNGSSDSVIGLGKLQQNFIAGVGGWGQQQQAYSATINYQFSTFILNSITSYSQLHSYDSFDFSFSLGSEAQTLFGVGGAPYSLPDNNFNKFVQDTHLSTPLGSHFDLLAGVYYTKENYSEIDVISASNPTTGLIVGQLGRSHQSNTYEEYAAYGDLTYHVTSRLDIQLGGRESHLDVGTDVTTEVGPLYGSTTPITIPAADTTSEEFTYLATARYRFLPNLMAYTRFASGYRPGGSNIVKPGVAPSYGPDKTYNYEVGLKGEFFDRKLTIDSSLFYIDWEGIQLQTRNSADFGFLINGSNAKSEGVQLAAEATPFKGLSISGWVDYDEAVLTQALPGGAYAPLYGMPGNRLPNTSRYSGNLTGNQDFSLGEKATGFVGGAVSYVGDRESVFTATPARQNFPAYTKSNLRAGAKYDSWTASVYANNVGDGRGILNGGLGYFYPFAYVYMKPRMVGFSLVKTF